MVSVAWAGYARIVRSAVLAERNTPYVEAARAAGASEARILRTDVLPNVVAPCSCSPPSTWAWCSSPCPHCQAEVPRRVDWLGRRRPAPGCGAGGRVLGAVNGAGRVAARAGGELSVAELEAPVATARG